MFVTWDVSHWSIGALNRGMSLNSSDMFVTASHVGFAVVLLTATVLFNPCSELPLCCGLLTFDRFGICHRCGSIKHLLHIRHLRRVPIYIQHCCSCSLTAALTTPVNFLTPSFTQTTAPLPQILQLLSTTPRPCTVLFKKPKTMRNMDKQVLKKLAANPNNPLRTELTVVFQVPKYDENGRAWQASTGT